MAEIRIKLTKPHAAQAEILKNRRRFNTIACGRRFGKTRIGINMLIEPALEGFPTAWFAPSYKQMNDVWRTTKRTLGPLIASKSETERRLELVTGGVIDLYSLHDQDIDVARGKSYKRIIVDEAAHIRLLQEAWENVIRPTLTDFQGDAYLFSTPKGRNFFFTLFNRELDNPEWKSFRFSSYDNPFIPRSEIDDAKRDLPVIVFAQEFLAEFLDNQLGVFRNVLACLRNDEIKEPEPGHTYAFGVDLARTTDFTVITVLDITENRLVYLDRFNQIDYITQAKRIKVLYDKFKPETVVVETNNAGYAVVDILERMNVPLTLFTTSNATKKTIIEALALAFEREDISIYQHPVLLHELEVYEVDSMGGTYRFSAPPGEHDDTVMSLALAWTQVADPLGRRRGVEQIGMNFYDPPTWPENHKGNGEAAITTIPDDELAQMFADYEAQNT